LALAEMEAQPAPQADQMVTTPYSAPLHLLAAVAAQDQL
jgi:hypothetical protein